MAFDLSQYETVEERLEKWWKDNEDGSIQTELVHRPNGDPNEFVFVARLYRTTADAIPVATGWASEIRTGSSFNKFACELAESSAIGRALANYIYSKKGGRPSRTEMERVKNSEENKVIYGRPGSRSAAVESALRQAFKADESKTTDPTPVSWSVGDVVDVATSPSPKPKECPKGQEMILRQGEKNGKPYYGYVCNCTRDKSQQCPAQWAKLTAAGGWYFEDKE
jgi:hypothetical protein